FGDAAPALPLDDEWRLDEPLTSDGHMRVVARGYGASAQRIVSFLVARGRFFATDDLAVRLACKAAVEPSAQGRLRLLARRAEIGTLSASLVHELASIIQGLHVSLYKLGSFVRKHARGDDDALANLNDACAASDRVISLYRAMRMFVQSSETRRRRCALG